MSDPIDWQRLAAAVAVVGAVATLAWRIVIGQARGMFAGRAAHAALADRVAAIEQAQRGAPTQSEMAALTARVAAVETGVAVTREAVDGVGAAIGRVEHLLDLLVENQLKQERPA